MAQLINGKLISQEVRTSIKEDVTSFKDQYGFVPGLAVIIVGTNPASQIYVRNKKKACEEVGMLTEVIEMDESTSEAELLMKIEELKNDSRIHGILVQLPLPKHINEENIIAAIPPEKDVDAFHTINVGKIFLGNYSFLPCTPAGIMELLKHEKIEISGKNCVVVGRSNIVGKPMAMLLLQANGTVTVCHSKTADLKAHTKEADILVVAIGKSKFITADMVKPGAVVIDVGMNRDSEGKLSGDVDFENVEKIASFITPVPGGVGPMTITMLLKNTITAAKKSVK